MTLCLAGLYKARNVAPDTLQIPPIFTNPQTSLNHLKMLVDIVKDQDIGKKNCLALKKRKNFCCNYFIPLIIGKDSPEFLGENLDVFSVPL